MRSRKSSKAADTIGPIVGSLRGAPLPPPAIFPPVGAIVKFPRLSSEGLFLILGYEESDWMADEAGDYMAYRAKVFSMTEQTSIYLWILECNLDPESLVIIQKPEPSYP